MAVTNSFAPCGFLPNFHAAQMQGSPTFQVKPPGPATSGTRNVCSKTLGLVSWVVRKAEMASWIQQATPEARKRLSEASSQENTSGVMPSSNMALANRSDSRISLESMAMLSPEVSVSLTPKQYMRAGKLGLASLKGKNAMPVGGPLGLAFGPAFGGRPTVWVSRDPRE